MQLFSFKIGGYKIVIEAGGNEVFTAYFKQGRTAFQGKFKNVRDVLKFAATAR